MHGVPSPSDRCISDFAVGTGALLLNPVCSVRCLFGAQPDPPPRASSNFISRAKRACQGCRPIPGRIGSPAQSHPLLTPYCVRQESCSDGRRLGKIVSLSFGWERQCQAVLMAAPSPRPASPWSSQSSARPVHHAPPVRGLLAGPPNPMRRLHHTLSPVFSARP